jgi:hypothetical protein
MLLRLKLPVGMGGIYSYRLRIYSRLTRKRLSDPVWFRQDSRVDFARPNFKE